ncbi:Pentatricopeptide repeat-containing protein At3g46790, chloroplastic [Linum grandiflorum]
MISGYGSNGEAKKAIDFFNEMIRFGVSPSSVSFVSVLEEGKALFDSMKSRFGMVPAVEHYAAMVDLLGRANRLEEAIKLVEDMRIEPGPVVLYDLEPEEKERIVLGHSEKLALAFGLVNTSHGEVIRITKNLRLCEDCHEFTKFISKFAGKEILVRDVNRLHRFRDGVCSCGDFW